jgi:hypothetical protein
MANGKFLFKYFCKGISEEQLKRQTEIESLACMSLDMFRTMLNNIELIERLVKLLDQESYSDFFEAHPVKKWLLERAVYELSLYKMKITEPPIVERR